jgi:hypothetical protein
MPSNWNRRDAMLRLGKLGLGAVTLPGLLEAGARQALASGTRGTGPAAGGYRGGKARSCILLYLWGGPPQQDMWDLKPLAPDGIRSEFAPIETAVPGIMICDQMPRIARHTDKFVIVRSLTHESNVHEVGVYHTLTGQAVPGLGFPRNQRTRMHYPHPGSVLSALGLGGDMPASVTIPRPIGHDGVTYAGTHAGFLGPRHDPLELQAAGEVNEQPAHNLALPDGLDTTRLLARHGLLKLLEAQDRLAERQAWGFDAYREQALRMLVAPETRAAFDLSREPDRLRDRYGRNEYGESFLLARRLVEAGVRLVTVVWLYICPDGNVANVWDNHGGTGSLGSITGYQMLKEKYCLPPLDQAFSALLEDLADRGLLEETLLVMLGEFGRTPKINATAGRDHWGPCQSAVLAGGGIRGGQVYGSSDRHAAYPTSNPVAPQDIIATVYHAFGIAPETVVYDQSGRPHRVSEGRPLVELF